MKINIWSKLGIVGTTIVKPFFNRQKKLSASKLYHFLATLNVYSIDISCAYNVWWCPAQVLHIIFKTAVVACQVSEAIIRVSIGKTERMHRIIKDILFRITCDQA